MPNTLAHFGLQGLATKAIARDADIKWIGIGCLIPDIPWIIQRLCTVIWPSVDLISLRIYCMIQASLFFSLILAAALSALSRRPLILFVILAANCLGHLLLDGLQTKWANGVHLFAPFDWRLTQLQLFWPESGVTLLLTAIGLAVILWLGFRDRRTRAVFSKSYRSVSILLLLATSYFIVPLFFFSGPYEADNHYVQTLRHREERAGKQIGFDRCRYDAAQQTITIFTGEELSLKYVTPLESGTISIKGRFKDPQTVSAAHIHLHGQSRDLGSYLGLSLLLILWGAAIITGRVSFE